MLIVGVVLLSYGLPELVQASGMLAAFTLAWLYLMIRRYQLARAQVAREEAVRRRRIEAARAALPPAGAPTEVAR